MMFLFCVVILCFSFSLLRRTERFRQDIHRSRVSALNQIDCRPPIFMAKSPSAVPDGTRCASARVSGDASIRSKGGHHLIDTITMLCERHLPKIQIQREPEWCSMSSV